MHHPGHQPVRGSCRRGARGRVGPDQLLCRDGCDANRQHQGRPQRGQVPRDRRPRPGPEPWRNTPLACLRRHRVPASQDRAAPRRRNPGRRAAPGPPGTPVLWWTPQGPQPAQPPPAGEPPAPGRREPGEVVVAPSRLAAAALRWWGPEVEVAALSAVRSSGRWWGLSKAEDPHSGRLRAAQAPSRKRGPRRPVRPAPGGNAGGDPTHQPARSQGAGNARRESRSTCGNAMQRPPLRPRPAFSAGEPGTTSWFGHPPWSAAGPPGHAGTAPRADAQP